MYKKTFIQMCLDGEATLFELDNYIDYWHENDTGVTLRGFLGLTPYEYQEWGNGSDSIFRDILRCRLEGIDLSDYEYMSEEKRIAARSYDEEAIDRLRKESDE